MNKKQILDDLEQNSGLILVYFTLLKMDIVSVKSTLRKAAKHIDVLLDLFKKLVNIEEIL